MGCYKHVTTNARFSSDSLLTTCLIAPFIEVWDINLDYGLGLCFEIHKLAVFKFQVQSIFSPVPLVMHIRTTVQTSIKVLTKNCNYLV